MFFQLVKFDLQNWQLHLLFAFCSLIIFVVFYCLEVLVALLLVWLISKVPLFINSGLQVKSFSLALRYKLKAAKQKRGIKYLLE